jgi:murein DD-endopeptidase MepM/ murein hydrolase activator NlpD
VTYHPILDGPINIVVSRANHPKVAKGGNHAVDIRTHVGEPIYAPGDGKIPDVHADQLDGGTKTSVFFTIDLTKAKKTDPAVRVVFAHLNRAQKGRAVVKAGEVIGTAAGETLHVGCNLADALDQIVAA